MKILVMNGPNINMTGFREEIYGSKTLEQINAELKDFAAKLGAELEFFQSNHEGDLIDRLQQGGFDGLVINAGALTHYSYALADALQSVKTGKVEVHMTNIMAREEFRNKSVISHNTSGAIMGFGADSYKLAIEYLIWHK